MSATTLHEALELGRNASRGATEHKQNLKQYGNFVEAFAATHWNLESFDDLKLSHVLQLISDMERQGRSPSYIRHAVNALKLASNYMSDYHGMQNLEVKQRHLPPVREAPKIWLSYNQLSKCCQVAADPTLRKRTDTTKSQPRPMSLARVIVMACGIAGLRLTEFGRLTPDCLDSQNNLTISADEETGKATKNDSSIRVLPIPAIVATAMREYWDKHGNWSTDRTSNGKRVRLLFQATAQYTGDDLYLITPPKNLRKTMANELDGAVEDKYLMAYGGWAFKGTMFRHYKSLRPRPDDHPTIKQRAIDKLRVCVSEEIEKKIAGLHF